MIELAPSQGENGHLQLLQFLVSNQWICTQGASEFGIEVVLFEVRWTRFTNASLHQQLYSLVAEQPDTNIRQIEMIFLYLAKCLYRGLLQHFLQYRRCTTITHKHTMILSH